MSISDTRLMRQGLSHRHPGLDDAEFFKMIDDTGGWPVGSHFVGFEHTSDRAAGFSCSSTNTGWWTTIASADDYYLWKLSPQALQRVVDAAIGAVRLPSAHFPLTAGAVLLRSERTTEKSEVKTWCEFSGVANCKYCAKQLYVALCPNYPKPQKGLSYRMVDDLVRFGPDWREKPVSVNWPTIDALVKRGVIEKRVGKNKFGNVWMFRRVMPAPTDEGLDVVDGDGIIKGNEDIACERGDAKPDLATNTLPIYPKPSDLRSDFP